MTEPSKLRVFLCHASQDKPVVRELYQRLLAEGWIDPWLDEEKLLPGQDWDLEIEKAVEAADAVVVCLSNNSVTKEGYVQKEIKKALDKADKKPEDIIFIIPLLLEKCSVPHSLMKWQRVEYFPNSQREQAIDRLIRALRVRAQSFEIPTDGFKKFTLSGYRVYTFGNIEFVKIPAGKFVMGSNEQDKDAHDWEKPQSHFSIPYDYYISRFLITNLQYAAFEKTASEGTFNEGNTFIEKQIHPVVNITWHHAQGYVRWLNEVEKAELPTGYGFRLPSEPEWEKAARGPTGQIYPWGNEFNSFLCHIEKGLNGGTTRVGYYSPGGDSPYGVADMVGNVLEWTRSLARDYPYNSEDGRENEFSSGQRVIRSCSYMGERHDARCAVRYGHWPDELMNSLGFRIVVSPV